MRHEKQSLLGVVKARQVVKRMMMNRCMIGNLTNFRPGYFVKERLRFGSGDGSFCHWIPLEIMEFDYLRIRKDE
jgi:hypothetical protein